MAYEQRDNSFSLWKNDYKKEGDKQPEYKGDGMVAGKLVKVSAWLNTTKDGKKYMSCKVEDKDSVQKGPKPPPIPKATQEDDLNYEDPPF